MQTDDKIMQNIQNLAKLFPHALVESKDEFGRLKKTIDFDLLKQECSYEIVESFKERYALNWPGKKEAIIEANKSTNKTLRPILEDSVDFENTKNLYIEGDNLEVLKLLQNSYLNSIKMIYIDPPYNTGKDFIYKDNFKKDKNEELLLSGQIDETGDKLVTNPQSNGRFHSDWLSMMYPRLKLARNLLKDDGVIFISIDDNEVHNLRKICDEIFGEGNFVYMLSIVNKLNGNDNSSGMMETQEHCLIYAKNKDRFVFGVLPLDEEESQNWQQDEIGYWKEGGSLKATGENAPKEKRPNLFFPIFIDEQNLSFSLEEDKKHTFELLPITDNKEMSWYWSKNKFLSDKTEVIIKKTSNGYSLYKKQRPQLGDLPSKRGKTTFYSPKYSTANSNLDIKRLFQSKMFDYSKSKDLIKDLISLGNTQENDIILDFFSGSATTAHAAMELNAQDIVGGRKFILVQIPEITDKNSEAYKAGYKNICEIGKERIKRAGIKIKQDYHDKKGIENLDVGFRVLRLESSNMQDVFYKPDEIKQENILQFATDNIKEDRSSLDLLFGIMSEWGLSLDLKIQKEEIFQKEVFIVNDNDLIVCFDENLDENFIKELAKKQALRVVFKDASFKNDSIRINIEQIFTQISPNTDIRVL